MGSAARPFQVSVIPAHAAAELELIEPALVAAEPTLSGQFTPAGSQELRLPELQIASPLGSLPVSSREHSPPSGPSLLGEDDGTGSASFFGAVANGSRFVYILDVSPSMNHREGQRLERAVLELLRSIDPLTAEQSFYVIVFGWQTRRMFDDGAAIPETVPATLKNKRALRSWLAGLTTLVGTDPTQAVKTALGMKPSAIFLLSDGEFNRPGRRRGSGGVARSVINAIRRARSDRIPVHTITYEDRAGERAMDRIASESGGLNRFVRAPAGMAPASRRKPLRYKVWPNFRRSVSEYGFAKEDARGAPTGGG